MKQHPTYINTLSFITAVALVLPTSAFATNGFFSHGYGTKHKGMAGAGVAAPQSAMSTATNPAALISQGTRFDGGLEYFIPKRDAVTRHDNVSYNGDGDESFLIPEFGYSSKIDNDKSWGIVIYGNGGMNTKYKNSPYDSSPPRIASGVNLEQLFISPSFAFKLNDQHSIGLSVNLIQQKFEAYGLDNFAGFKDPAGATGNTNGLNLTDMGEDTSTGWSIKFGWIGDLTSTLSFAASYQTLSEMSKFDKYKELFAEQGTFNIPSNWTIGLKLEATPVMNVMFDIQQINYTDSASISNPNGSGAGTGFLGADNGRGFGWDDMTIYKLGMDFTINPSIVMRAGYSNGTQPIGADDTSFNLIAPAVIEDHITIGGTFILAGNAELSLFYMRALENEVKGNDATNGLSGNADIKMSQDALGVAYGLKF